MAATGEKLHAKFSASGADRWLNCAGSTQLAEKAPPQKDSVYSAEGTQAHTCLETFLKNPKKSSAKIRKMLLGANPEEMVDHCLEAANEIWAIHESVGGSELLSETEVRLDFVQDEMWGTTDAAVVEHFGRLRVIDFKYGAGIAVDPEHNPQMIYYGLGIAHLYDYNFADVELTVIQPRAEHHSGKTTRSWVLSIDELKAWGEKFKAGVDAAEDILAEFTPGDWCRFCPGKSICPAVSDLALMRAEIDFRPTEPAGELKLPLPAIPAIPLLGRTLKAIELIEQWIEGVRAHAIDVLESGGKVEGYKLVMKKAQRAWKQELEAAVVAKAVFEVTLSEISAPQKMLSPAQLEIKFKKHPKLKEFLDEFVTRESSGTTMVDDADKRPAVNQAALDFAEADAIDVEGKEVARESPEQNRLPDIFARATTKPKKPKASVKRTPKRTTKVKAGKATPKAKGKSRKR